MTKHKIMEHVHQWQILQPYSTKEEVVWVCSICPALTKRITIQLIEKK